MATNEFWNQDDLLQAVRDSHEVLENATFFHKPDWTVAELQPDAIQANVSFTVEDPNGGIAQALNKAWVVMFSSQVLPQAWKEKIGLRQCTRCWKLDSPQHPACAERCIVFTFPYVYVTLTAPLIISQRAHLATRVPLSPSNTLWFFFFSSSRRQSPTTQTQQLTPGARSGYVACFNAHLPARNA